MTDQPRIIGPLAVIVMGVSGSGKSTVGQRLAQSLGCPFLEGDDYHSPEAVEKMRSGVALTDEDRWPWLERLGRAIDAEAADDAVAVAACSALKAAYRDLLRKVISAPVRFVWLEVPRDELLRRLTQRAHHYMPASLLESQVATLEPPRPGEPVITLEASQPAEALCEQALARLAVSGC